MHSGERTVEYNNSHLTNVSNGTAHLKLYNRYYRYNATDLIMWKSSLSIRRPPVPFALWKVKALNDIPTNLRFKFKTTPKCEQ
jgi:hypothetical protein